MTEEVNVAYAPWTDDQVANLQRYQNCPWVHPYTCGEDGCGAVLTPTKAGWICPSTRCNYEQHWCGKFLIEFTREKEKNFKTFREK